MRDHFGQNDQKPHKNYKINIFRAKKRGDMEGQATTRGNPDIGPFEAKMLVKTPFPTQFSLNTKF